MTKDLGCAGSRSSFVGGRCTRSPPVCARARMRLTFPTSHGRDAHHPTLSARLERAGPSRSARTTCAEPHVEAIAASLGPPRRATHQADLDRPRICAHVYVPNRLDRILRQGTRQHATHHHHNSFNSLSAHARPRPTGRRTRLRRVLTNYGGVVVHRPTTSCSSTSAPSLGTLRRRCDPPMSARTVAAVIMGVGPA